MNNDNVFITLIKCEGCSCWFTKGNEKDQKIREREARGKEGMHWQWDVIQKMKTRIKTKFDSEAIVFEKTLEFKQAILLCY